MSTTNEAPTGTAGEGPIEKVLAGTGTFLDDRLRAAKSTRTLLKKIFPDHWTFLLGEIALYSFVILILTGTFLAFFFQPSMSDMVYHGTYVKLDGVHMSRAYASTLNISFDVRGGLLIRQIHHWAADLFVAAIMAHMLRIFFTGAYRKPREINWLIGLVMFTLALIEGLFGYSLPDDLLSGAGLRITQGVLQSIPVVGEDLAEEGPQTPGAMEPLIQPAARSGQRLVDHDDGPRSQKLGPTGSVKSCLATR